MNLHGLDQNALVAIQEQQTLQVQIWTAIVTRLTGETIAAPKLTADLAANVGTLEHHLKVLQGKVSLSIPSGSTTSPAPAAVTQQPTTAPQAASAAPSTVKPEAKITATDAVLAANGVATLAELSTKKLTAKNRTAKLCGLAS